MNKIILKKNIIFAGLLFTLISPTSVFAQLPRAASLLTGPQAGLSLGTIISQALGVVFSIAGLVAFVWGFIGVFQYITAGGNKEGLAKAKGRITWAFVGLIFLGISFGLAYFVRDLFQFTDPGVP